MPLEPIYPFDYTHFFSQDLHLIASVTPLDETFMTWAADLLGLHEQELAFLITHRFGVDRSTEAYTLYEPPASDRSWKVLVDGAGRQKMTASASGVGVGGLR